MKISNFTATIKRIETSNSALAVFKKNGGFAVIYDDTVAAAKYKTNAEVVGMVYIGTYSGLVGASKFAKDSRGLL